MASSCAKQNPVPMNEPAMKYVEYPAAQVRYEDVVASPKTFMATLEKFHASMETKFMIPTIGGKELDLHRLFVEVTSRGGIEKVLRERRWKEVTAIFNFPPTATNASFVLRKYYMSLLHHYERLYFFESHGWNPTSPSPLQSPLVAEVPAQVAVQPSPEYQAATAHQQQKTNAAGLSGARAAPSATPTTQVMGVIDGKFDSGYLVTVTIGSEKLKGVLYQAPQYQSSSVPQPHGISASNSGNDRVIPGTQRRRRRKKNEIKRRDPAHPKPNRSGYNFFFAEQHARLKPLYPGKDREISRMIGELWNKLKEPEKSIYQEQALKDKERYRIEMEDYRERLRTGRVISDAVPIQWVPEKDSDMMEVDMKNVETGAGNPQSVDNESSSGESDSEDDVIYEAAEKELDDEASPEVGLSTNYGNMGTKTSAQVAGFELSKGEENVGDGSNKNLENTAAETKKEKVPGEEC